MEDNATTVEQYLAGLPADRQAALEEVRRVVVSNLDKDYEEGMQYGMIAYYVPHRVYPAGYHCDPTKPLLFAALASQKNYMTLHLMCVYGHEPSAEHFREAWAKTGKKLDMGKACIRFKRIEDLALKVIGATIRRVPVKKYLQHYEELMQMLAARTTKGPPGKKSQAKQASKKRTAR
jgi:hypothetical protein